MKFFNKKLSVVMLIIWDLATAILAVSTGAFLTFGSSIVVRKLLLPKEFIIVSAVPLVLFSILFRCYNNVWVYAGVSELVSQFFAVLASSAVVFGILGFVTGFGTSFEIAAIAGIIELVLTAGVRVVPRIWRWFNTSWNKQHMGDQVKKVIIIGAGQAGSYLAKRLQSNKNSNRWPVAFIDDDPGIWDKKVCGVPVVGSKDKIIETVKKYGAREIIIAIPSANRQALKEIYEYCKDSKCSIKRYGTMLDVNEDSLERIKIDDINVEDLLSRDVIKLDMNIISKFITGKTVLVTGGAGSIGSEICRQVLKWNPKQLLIFDIHENGLFDIDNELKKTYGDKSSYKVLLGSVRDRDRLQEIFEEYSPQIVFHAAAHKHVPMMEWNPKEAIKNNVFGTINVAGMAAKYGADKFILISTDKAVNPTNIMGASKRIAELVLQSFNSQYTTEFAAVRFGNVLGSNGSVIPTFKKQIEDGGPVTVTHPDIMRYFMTIPEAVQLVLEAGAMANGGEIMVLDMGEPVKIYDLACTLIRLSGLEPDKDIKIEFTGLRPGEKMFEEINLSDENVSKTANDKIYVMKSNGHNSKMFVKDMMDLEKTLESDDLNDMFAQVKNLVPTFDHNINGQDVIYEKAPVIEMGTA